MHGFREQPVREHITKRRDGGFKSVLELFKINVSRNSRRGCNGDARYRLRIGTSGLRIGRKVFRIRIPHSEIRNRKAPMLCVPESAHKTIKLCALAYDAITMRCDCAFDATGCVCEFACQCLKLQLAEELVSGCAVRRTAAQLIKIKINVDILSNRSK